MNNQRSILGNYLQESVVRKIRELNHKRDAVIDALKTKADAEAYVKSVREKIAACFPMPQDRSVPKSEIIGVVEYPEFRIEKIIYYSRENFPVTANLYLPKTSGKHPGTIFLCGHSADGKAALAYKSGAANLAIKGFATLIIDPVSQGERWQFVGVPNTSAVHGFCTREHNVLGKQLRLCGDFFGAWRAYDALRGLDYLLSRPEIDSSRIGITGNSGGGTMTTFTQALDERFTMAAPSCYVTSWKRNFENELPADVEQIPPGILAAGCEMGDFILAYAPRPIILLGQKNDFFDPRGLLETYNQVKKVYALLGAEENIQCFIGPGNHGYSIENREAMYEFFSKHAAINVASKETFDGSLIPLKDILCTSTGQLATARPELSLVHDLIGKCAAGLKAERKALSPAEIKAELYKLLQLPETIDEPYARLMRGIHLDQIPDDRRFLGRFALEDSDGMISMLKLNSESAYYHFPALDKLTIYIPHLDGGSEVVKLEREPGEYIAALDVRGLGETLPLGTDQRPEQKKFDAVYSQDYHYDSVALMYGTSTIALRVLDILRAIEFVKARGVKKIELAGRGQGALPALFAALISDDVSALTVYDALESYQSIIDKRMSNWPQSCMVPGILKYMDLPDIYGAVRKSKPCNIVNFVKEPIPEL